MTLPPAYQFPTTTVFLDDDLDFVNAMEDSLKSGTILVKKFDDHKKALSYLQSNTALKTWNSAWTRICPSDNDFDSVAIEVNFSQICTLLKDLNRFNRVTTAIVDYQMPYLDGLSFLGMLKDIPVKKVLLTGVADAEIAVKALDRGLIDAYIRKHDPRLLCKVKNIIYSSQLTYFQEQSKIINLALRISQSCDPLLSSSYCNIFNTIKENHKAIEHYFMDENGSCMFVNEKAERIDLVVRSLEQLSCDHDNLRIETRKFEAFPLRVGYEFYYSIEGPFQA